MRLKGGQVRRRNKEVTLWLSEDEHHQLKEDAAKAGLSIQTYLRLLMQQIQPKEMPTADLVSILKSLQQIGNNINQIAVKANANGFVDAAAYWENVRWLQQTVSKLLEVMY